MYILLEKLTRNFLIIVIWLMSDFTFIYLLTSYYLSFASILQQFVYNKIN